MSNPPPGSERVLLERIEACLADRDNILGHGYQGHTYRLCSDDQSLAVKAPLGSGLTAWVSRWMLYNEYRVYRRLAGMAGVPVCYGFLGRRYLVLECVDGIPLRSAEISDPDYFFRTLLERIRRMHHRGIAHGDLKKKDNILVVNGREPWLIDFGVAVVRRDRIAPLNHYRFRLFQRFDYNAWVKLKLRRVGALSAAEQEIYHRTMVESAAGWIKQTWKKSKGLLKGR